MSSAFMAATFVQVAPASAVRYMPPRSPSMCVVPASSTEVWVGWMASRFTKRQSALASTLVAPSSVQVSPPSSDLKAPTPTSPALASPVPR